MREGDKVRSVYVGYIGKGTAEPGSDVKQDPRETIGSESGVKNSNISKAIDMYDSGESFIVFDTETTGVDSNKHKIIQVSARRYKIRDNQLLKGEKFDSYVNPHQEIPPMITSMTGITRFDVMNAPDIKDVLPEFREFVGRRRMVAQNALFDLRMLNVENRKHNYPEYRPARVVDTLKLSRKLYPNEKKHNLETIGEREGIEVEGELHDSMVDVEVTARAYHRMTRKIIKIIDED